MEQRTAHQGGKAQDDGTEIKAVEIGEQIVHGRQRIKLAQERAHCQQVYDNTPTAQQRLPAPDAEPDQPNPHH